MPPFRALPALLYIQHKSLEVFPFGMIDIYRMVGSLGQLMKNPHAAACLRGSRKHSTPEILLAHHLRTGESEKNAAGTDLLECLGIQFGVAPSALRSASRCLANAGGSRIMRSYWSPMRSRNLKASSAKAWWRLSPGKFSSTFWRVRSIALAELSTE